MGERADSMSDPRAPGDAGAASEMDPAVIEAQIEATREEMSETIAAIEERLAPEHLVEQATGAVRELAGQATSALSEATAGKAQQVAVQTRETAERVRGGLWSTTTQNPIPGTLIAIGLGWLWRQQARSSGRHRADGLPQAMGGQRQQSEQGLWRMVETNPLAAGALGLVLGGIVGLIIPETEKEHQVMGETRDRLMHEARMAGSQAIGGVQEQVQAVAEQAIQTVTGKAQDVLPSSGKTSGESE
jgi:uncharacterized protein YjbJ (UPF0337 family)